MSFRPIIGEKDLEAVYRADVAAYAEEALPKARIAEWLAKYPDGALIAWDNDRVAASIGVWPLTEAAYRGLIDGTLHEADIQPEKFPVVTKESPCAYWTLAAVYVHPDYRGSDLLPELMARRFRHLAQSGHASERTHLLGLALSAGGERVLARLGFKPSGHVREHLPPHELAFDHEQLSAMPQRILSAYAHRAAELRPLPTPNSALARALSPAQSIS
jgi:GNAT superfamily N-acetyltransferase